MSGKSEDEWENAVLVGLGVLVLWRLFGPSGASARDYLRSKFEPSLPDGARLPGRGEMREVKAVRTILDVSGFPALFNQAVQIVDAPTYAAERWLSALTDVELQPSVPAVDPGYDAPARFFATQSALETADGHAVWNFNLGNLTTNAGDYYVLHAADVKDGTPHRFESFNFPLQGAIAMVDRIRRLWPDAFKVATYAVTTGFSDATLGLYAHALQDGRLKYAGSNVTGDGLAASLSARARHLGWLT